MKMIVRHQIANRNLVEKPLLDYYPDAVICVCMEVNEGEIRDAILQGATTVQALSKRLLIGTGCSSCISEVEAIIKEMAKQSSISSKKA